MTLTIELININIKIIVIVLKLYCKICNNIRLEFSSHVSRVKINYVCVTMK